MAAADALADAISPPSFRSGRGRPRRRGRRVTRVVRRIELWSVLKIALVFNTIFLGVALGSVALLWGLANTTGLVDDLEGFLRDAGFEDFRFQGDRMFEQVAFIGAVGALAATVFMVLATALLNLISEITGGIKFVVIEEIVEPVAAPARPPAPLALPTVPTAPPPAAAPVGGAVLAPPPDPAPPAPPGPNPAASTGAARSRGPAPYDRAADDDEATTATSTAAPAPAKPARPAKKAAAKKRAAKKAAPRTAAAQADPSSPARGSSPGSGSDGPAGRSDGDRSSSGAGRRVRRAATAPGEDSPPASPAP